MAGNYKNKTNRCTTSEKIYRQAAGKVLSKKNSLRNAAEKYEINCMTLQRYIKKKSKLTLEINSKLVGYSKHRQIFSEALEAALSTYLLIVVESIMALLHWTLSYYSI